MAFLQFWHHLRIFCFTYLLNPWKQRCNWRALHCHVVQFSSVIVSLCCNADLKILEVTHNQIHTLPDDVGALRHLECLYMRHNKLTNLPLLDNCNSLKVSVLFNVHVCCYKGWLDICSCCQNVFDQILLLQCSMSDPSRNIFLNFFLACFSHSVIIDKLTECILKLH